MARKKNILPFVIERSKTLDELINSSKFSNKTTLEKIDTLNKFRYKNYYSYNSYGFNNLIEDQYCQNIAFNHVFDESGIPAKPLYFFKDNITHQYMVKYAVDAANSELLTDIQKPAIPYSPHGNNYAIRPIEIWLRADANRWNCNERHMKLLKILKQQYANAWLELKRRKVAELKRSLDVDSINDYVAARKAEKTQAIMDIAMAISSLTAKLETFRNRIGNISSAMEANKLFSEAENTFYTLRNVHNRNLRRLNDKTRIPGGAKTKKVIENKK